MGSVDGPSFTASPETIAVDALLFDFDGTIIDSTQAIVKHWHKLGEEMGVDPKIILATSHGRRSIDVLKIYDPSRANNEYISRMEEMIPKVYGKDAVEIPGARKLLDKLDSMNAPWAIVTSGTRALLKGWLDVLQLSQPKTTVIAEDVDNGKPDPTCYLLGQQRLNLAGCRNVIVFEDAPAGIRAGKAAGFKVVGLATTHSLIQVKEAGADWIVRDLQSIAVERSEEGSILIKIQDALVS